MIALTINGKPHQFERALSISELLQALQLTDKRIAIERNGEIVPRGNFNQETIAAGDNLEIVVAVGGG